MTLTAHDVSTRLRTRLDEVRVTASDDAVLGCAEYLLLLRRWNAKLNLAGFDLDEPSDAAIDRLLVEPLAAARFARREDRTIIDIGTGGGSPAVPFKLACPWLAATWFEGRVRKAGFLRELVRALALTDVDVQGVFGYKTNIEPVDIITVRAVRVDDALGRGIEARLRQDGRVLLFGAAPAAIAGIGWHCVPLWTGGPINCVGVRTSLDILDGDVRTT